MASDTKSLADQPVCVERLTTECPTHGTVPVACPRCIGRRGGKRHKGTNWKRKRLQAGHGNSAALAPGLTCAEGVH